jgi:hypothetical protein
MDISNLEDETIKLPRNVGISHPVRRRNIAERRPQILTLIALKLASTRAVESDPRLNTANTKDSHFPRF